MIKGIAQKPPVGPESSAIHFYSALDPIPVAEAVESDTDAAWALWEDAIKQQNSGFDTAFENTRPAELLPLQATAFPSSTKRYA